MNKTPCPQTIKQPTGWEHIPGTLLCPIVLEESPISKDNLKLEKVDTSIGRSCWSWKGRGHLPGSNPFLAVKSISNPHGVPQPKNTFGKKLLASKVPDLSLEASRLNATLKETGKESGTWQNPVICSSPIPFNWLVNYDSDYFFTINP